MTSPPYKKTICSTGQDTGKSLTRNSHRYVSKQHRLEPDLGGGVPLSALSQHKPQDQYYRSKRDVTSWCTGRRNKLPRFVVLESARVPCFLPRMESSGAISSAHPGRLSACGSYVQSCCPSPATAKAERVRKFAHPCRIDPMIFGGGSAQKIKAAQICTAL